MLIGKFQPQHPEWKNFCQIQFSDSVQLIEQLNIFTCFCQLEVE